MTRVIVIDGCGPVTVNVADFDVIVFHHSARAEICDRDLEFERVYPPLPDLDDLTQYKICVVDKKKSASQSWKDPWPGRRR